MAEHECVTRLQAVSAYMRTGTRVIEAREGEDQPVNSEAFRCPQHGVLMWIVREVADAAP